MTENITPEQKQKIQELHPLIVDDMDNLVSHINQLFALYTGSDMPAQDEEYGHMYHTLLQSLAGVTDVLNELEARMIVQEEENTNA
jgi:hypothetical protein